MRCCALEMTLHKIVIPECSSRLSNAHALAVHCSRSKTWLIRTLLLQVRIMSQAHNRLEVTILPPYLPSEAEQKDPDLYADNVRRLYSQTLNLPLSSEASPNSCLARSFTHLIQNAGLVAPFIAVKSIICKCCLHGGAFRQQCTASALHAHICSTWSVHGCRQQAVTMLWTTQGVAEFLALSRRGLCISLDGRKVTAPPGLLDSQGCVDLTDKTA